MFCFGSSSFYITSNNHLPISLGNLFTICIPTTSAELEIRKLLSNRAYCIDNLYIMNKSSYLLNILFILNKWNKL